MSARKTGGHAAARTVLPAVGLIALAVVLYPLAVLILWGLGELLRVVFWVFR